jgi:alkylation response protein AidB-like acyl-CoA dehydrogenase
VDLFPSVDQELLAETASDFVARSIDPQVVRSLEAGDAGYDPDHWATMAALGWTELAPLELALVADRLGRGPLPSPLGVTGALRNALPSLAADLAPDAVLTLAGPTPVEVEGDSLSGAFLLVPYAARAARVVAATPRGLVTFDPAAGGVACTRHDAIGGDPLYRVECSGVAVRTVGGSVATMRDHVAITALAYAVGVAEGALALAVQHAKDRHQFGRPIGSFQAVAHRCADMRAEIDACRALALRSAWALGRGRDATFEVSSALAYAKDALRRVAMHAHQVHGAIGFSTEHDLHLYTRRIKAFELDGGSSAHYQERLAAAIGLEA